MAQVAPPRRPPELVSPVDGQHGGEPETPPPPPELPPDLDPPPDGQQGPDDTMPDVNGRRHDKHKRRDLVEPT